MTIITNPKKLAFIRKNYSSMTARELADKLYLTEARIKALVAKLGLSKAHPKHNIWTDERIKILCENYTIMTAADLAEKLGVSRNTVIGKANRMRLNGGFKGRRKPPMDDKDIEIFRTLIARYAPITVAKKMRRPLSEITSAMALYALRIKVNPRGSAPQHKCVVQTNLSRTLISLDRKQCHSPLDDDTWCGDPVADGKPYCKEHCAINYKPNSKPKTQDPARKY